MSISQFSPELALSLSNSRDEFPVDFNDAWQWLEYKNKRDALQFVIKNLEINLDYVMLQPQLGTLAVPRPETSVMLTVEAFKTWGMMSRTEQGKAIRKYFLDCEKIAKQAKESTSKKLHSDKERAAGIVARREHTDAIAMFNPTPKDYAIATNQTYLGMFGQTAAEIKDERGLKQKQSAREGMNDVELAAIRLTELAVARDRSIANLNQLSAANFVQADAISKALKVRHLLS